MRGAGFLLVAALIGVADSTAGAQTPAVDASTGALRVGRAAVVITPPLGSIMGNSYGVTVSRGIQDELHARAIVLEQNGVTAALVACDLVSLRGPIVEETRRRIQALTGIPGDRVILSATHAHAGPQLNPLFWAGVGGEPARKSEAYTAALPGLIAESVRRARADLRPARASVGRVREDGLSFNRRFLLRDGTVKMNAGVQNPEIVRAMGPIDPDVSVVVFESLDGSQRLATLVNFALHVAIVGGDHFSADFPAVLAERLRAVEGDSMVTVFTTGTSGNVNDIDVSRPRRLSGRAQAVRVGTVLAADVLRAYADLRPLRPGPLRAASREVVLPVPSVTAREVQWARGVMSRVGGPDAPPLAEQVPAWRILDLHELGGRPLRSEVQAITLGDDLALVGFPGDAFVELGLAVKQNSPFAFTVVSEQSGNGAISYVPNRKAFPEGGYEVVSARFSPGGGEILTDATLQLLVDLAPRAYIPTPGPR